MLREGATTPTAHVHGTPPHSITYGAQLRAVAVPNASGARRGFEELIANRQRHGNPERSSVAPSRMPAATPITDAISLLVGVAESVAQKEAVDHLIRRRYAWRGYSIEKFDDQAPSLRGDGSRRETTFFVANHETTLGTITLGLDGADGLQAERTHGEAIQQVRAVGRCIGELTRLAVAEGVDSRLVLASLFGLVYAVGRVMQGVADVFIEVNPRHVAFYSRALGFVVAGNERFCARVGAPSVLLHLEVGSLEHRLGLANSGLTAEPLVQDAERR